MTTARRRTPSRRSRTAKARKPSTSRPRGAAGSRSAARSRTTAPARSRARSQPPIGRRSATSTAAARTRSPGRSLSPSPRSLGARPKVTVEGERLSARIVLVTLGLTLFGLVMVLSASSAASLYQLEASPLYQFKRQAMWAVVGAVVFLVSRAIDYRLLARFSGVGVVSSILLLIAVVIPGVGTSVNGSRRWLVLGPAQIQPSEIAKLALVVFAADLLARRASRMGQADLTVRPVMVVVAVMSGLLIIQPKLGTPIVMTSIIMVVLFVAGARLGSLVSWGALGVAAVSFFAMSASYRRDRLLAFMDPWQYSNGIGLQTVQSQIGIASGGLLGVGLGGSRAKWGFLPEAQSDFIFAVVAEEIGLIGAACTIGAFLLFGYLGVRTAIGAPDRLGMLLATGLTTWIMVQAFLNIGMTLGNLPITGEPLPFMSVGGSSLVATLAASGLLANIARRARL